MRVWGAGILIATACGGRVAPSSGSCLDGGGCPAGSACSSTGECVPTGSGGSGVGGSGGVGSSGGVGGGVGFGGAGGVGGTGSGGVGGGGGGGGGVGGVGAFGGYTCDSAAIGTPTPGSCVPDDPSDPCQHCVQANCCAQYEACLGTNPNNPCAWGAPDGSGEIFCIVTRIQAGETPPEAAGACTSPGCGTISGATNDLFTCLDALCAAECQLFQQ